MEEVAFIHSHLFVSLSWTRGGSLLDIEFTFGSAFNAGYSAIQDVSLGSFCCALKKSLITSL